MSINPLNDISKVYLEQVATQEVELDEGITLKDYKKKRSALKQKEKRAADKIAPGRRAGIHNPEKAPERAARRDASYGETGHGGALRPKKVRKAKALGELGESSVPGKPAEKLGAVTSIPKAERDAARERVLAKAKAMREKRGIKTEAVKGADPEMRKAASAERKSGDKRLSPSTGKGYADQQKQSIAYMDKLTKKNKNVVGLVTKEALDPVGKEDADVDNDGKKNTNADKYLLKRRKAIGKAISTQEAKEVKRWWDDDGDGKGYEEGEVSGKFKKKKKIKEGFSNWREDLIEVADAIEKEENEEKITEKKVKNKIKINPNMGEAVENLGGTLLEMVEVDEMDYILESVYDELLEEGYEEDDIEEAIEYSLTEAKVTFGHDTAPEKKKSGLMTAAKARLSSLKKSAKQAVASGARKVAKGALGVARKMEGGDKTPSAAHTGTRKASTYRGAGVGQKERVSSGSYQAPTKKKSGPVADPWEGSATTPAKPKAKAKAPAAKAKTTKVSGGTAKAPAKRKRSSKLDDLLASVRSEEVQQIDELSVNKMHAYINKAEKDRDRLNKKWDQGTATPKERKKVFDREEGEARASKKIKQKTGKDSFRLNALDKLKSAITKEEVQIDEKVLTAAETKKKEELVKSMKKSSSDFEARYPGRGKEVMYATATKIAKKVAEQALEMQPKTQSSQQKPDQNKSAINSVLLAKQKVDRAEQELSNKQRMAAGKKIDLQSLSAGYEPEGEVIGERTRYARETGKHFRTTRPSVKSGNSEIQNRRENEPFLFPGSRQKPKDRKSRVEPQKPLVTPAYKVARRQSWRADTTSAQNMYRPRPGESD